MKYAVVAYDLLYRPMWLDENLEWSDSPLDALICEERVAEFIADLVSYKYNLLTTTEAVG